MCKQVKRPTCAEVYADRHVELMSLIKELQVAAETHAMRHAMDKTNWGYVGDLDMMIDGVRQALGAR